MMIYTHEFFLSKTPLFYAEGTRDDGKKVVFLSKDYQAALKQGCTFLSQHFIKVTVDRVSDVEV